MHHVAIVRVSCVKPNCLNDLVCSVNSYMFQFLFLRHRHFLEYAAVSQYLPSVWCGFVISVCVLCLVSSRLVSSAKLCIQTLAPGSQHIEA